MHVPANTSCLRDRRFHLCRQFDHNTWVPRDVEVPLGGFRSSYFDVGVHLGFSFLF